MSTETIIGLVQFCLLCLGLAVHMPCIYIVLGACIHWVQTKHKDSFVDSVNYPHLIALQSEVGAS